MYYIEKMKIIYNWPIPKIVEHMFATLGNGARLDHLGYLVKHSYLSDDFRLGDPEPFTSIYPWSDTTQPFCDLAGCRDVGFKEAAQYFIDCIEITPGGSIEHIDDWKRNIDIVKRTLLNTPTLEGPYTKEDMGMFLTDVYTGSQTIDNIAGRTEQGGGDNSVSKVWFFDVQWSDCPDIVEEEVKSAWRAKELGNDVYMWKEEFNDELFEEYPRVYFWLKYKGVVEGETVIIHWWW